MLTNVDQVENYFSNPENVHKLHVYEIVDFDNNIESVISQNTNNFLKIKYIGVRKGIYESCSFSPQIKILTNESDVGIKINTDLVFITNDDFSFLERTKKTYVFTINEEFSSTNDDVYFITDNSIKAMNELSDADLDQIKLDDASNLVDLYSIGLQNIKKLEVGKNSTVNFKLIEDLPNFNGENKITKITYHLPINSLIQAIQIIGNIKHELVDIGNVINNEQINIDIENNGVGAIPLFVRLKNTNPKANLEIMNFSLDKQLPLSVYKKVITKQDQSFASLFEEFKEDGKLPKAIDDLVALIKKLILTTYIYSFDFDLFDKNNKDFVDYYNIVYANKKAIDYATQLIAIYEQTYPEIIDTIAYSYFKAICYSLSNIMISPFSYKEEKLTYDQQKTLWFYPNVPFTKEQIKSSFNTDGSFKSNDQLFEFKMLIDSKYFLINYDNSSNITLTNRKLKFNDVLNGNYLPRTTISKIEEDWYQVWLFTQTKQDAYDIVYSFHTGKYEVNEKTISLTNPDRFPTEEELKKLLPPDAKNISILYKKEEMIETDERIYEPCQEINLWSHYSHDADYCTYRRYDGPHGPGGGGGYSYQKIKRVWTYAKTYKTTISFQFETKYNFVAEETSYTASQLFNFLFVKNNYKNSYVDVSFTISEQLKENNWYISNIKDEYCFGFFNSPNKMTINYLDKNNKEQNFVYEINNSFQKIDNCNPLTRNKY